MDQSILNTQNSYDQVTVEYAEKFKDEMDEKPFDCASSTTLGVDLSPRMVEEAQRLNPEIPFHQGDMLCLPDADQSWGGIAAFYCIIHIPRERISDALREMKRVLKPGGVLLLAFHIGSEIKHLDEWWKKTVDLDFAFYRPEEMEDWLGEAGYEPEETLVREPNPEVEVETKRSYIFAKKPLSA